VPLADRRLIRPSANLIIGAKLLFLICPLVFKLSSDANDEPCVQDRLCAIPFVAREENDYIIIPNTVSIGAD